MADGFIDGELMVWFMMVNHGLSLWIKSYAWWWDNDGWYRDDNGMASG